MMRNKKANEVSWQNASIGELGLLVDPWVVFRMALGPCPGILGYPLIHRSPGPTSQADEGSRGRHRRSQVCAASLRWKLKTACALFQGTGLRFLERGTMTLHQVRTSDHNNESGPEG